MALRKLVVVISSTSLDLPEYRAKAIEVCRRLGFDTSEMELLTADTAPPVDVSRRLVDGADVYVGIVAFRHGTVPEGESCSITEMEYERAVAREIPRLLFLMDPDHPWPRSRCDANLEQVEGFRRRMGRPGAHTVGRFTTVDNLGMLLGQALQNLTVRPRDEEIEPGEVAIRSYLQRLEREAGEIGMFGLGQDLQLRLPIREVYVNLALDAVHSSERVEWEGADDEVARGRVEGMEEVAWDEVMRNTFARSEKTRKRAVCIKGDPGSGKTTVAKKIAWELASGTRQAEEFGLEPGTVPVLLRFRDLTAEEVAAAGRDLLRWWVVEKTADGMGESPGEALYGRGKVLWILDGLDEVVSGEVRKQVLDYLELAIEARFGRGDRFLLTSRFSAFEREVGLPAVFQEFHVKALPWEQVEVFVRRWFGTAMEALHLGAGVAREKAEGLLGALGQEEYRVGRLRELCRNPLMLTILCVVYHRNAQLPHSRAEVYSHCVDVLLGYWKQSGFDMPKARTLLRLVAWHLHGLDDRAHAPKEELAALVEGPLKQFGDPRLGTSGAEFLRQMRNDCGILAGAGGGNLGFLHLTFQEFLASEHALREGKVEVVAERAGVKWWREVALLTARMASQAESVRYYRVLLGKDLGEAEMGRLVGQCLEESLQFPSGPVLEQMEARDEAGRVELLRCLQARKTLEEPVLDAVERVAREGGSGSELWTLGAGILARQGREIEAGADAWLWVEPRTGMTFRWVPPGSFTMGDKSRTDSPPHPVSLTQGVWMGAHPVTNGQYGLYLKETGAKAPEYWNDSQWNGERQPVVGVNWEEARAFASWLGEGGDLPTEAQWEYACRAGTETRYSFGDDEAMLEEYAWYDKNSERRTHDVGTKKPNPWGLYDMHGNVWEWCRDWRGDYPKGAVTDPTGPSQGGDRVLRGGCWNYGAGYCASGFRFGYPPAGRDQGGGFRAVLPPSPGGR